MNISELKDRLKSGNIGGCYIFGGSEDYLKKHYLRELAKIASPEDAFDLFNRVSFDGEEIDFPALREAIASVPMFSDFKLIEWRYASIDSMNEGERRRLEELAAFTRDYPYAVLVIFVAEEGFELGTVKKPSKLAQRLGKSYNIINFEKSTDAQLMGWLKKHFDAAGVAVSYEALSAMLFRCGHSMQILKNEQDKLAGYAVQNNLSAITEREVYYVTSPTLECDAFALSTAITDKNREAAFTALLDMRMRRIEPVAVMAMLCRAFSELATVSMLADEGMGAKDMESALGWNPYKIKICLSSAKSWGTERLSQALGRLRELDGMSKSGGVAGFSPIEIFISEYL